MADDLETEASRFGTDILLANSFTLVLLSIVSSTYFLSLVTQPGLAYGSLGLLFYNSSILANFLIVVWTIFLALHTRAGSLRALLGKKRTLTPKKVSRRTGLDIGLTITGIVSTLGNLLTLVVIAGLLKNLPTPLYGIEPSHVLGGFLLSITIASLYSLFMVYMTIKWLAKFVEKFYLSVLTKRIVEKSSRLWLRGGFWIVVQIIWIVGIVGTVNTALPNLAEVVGQFFVAFGLVGFLIPLVVYYFVKNAMIRYLKAQSKK